MFPQDHLESMVLFERSGDYRLTDFGRHGPGEDDGRGKCTY